MFAALWFIYPPCIDKTQLPLFNAAVPTIVTCKLQQKNAKRWKQSPCKYNRFIYDSNICIYPTECLYTHVRNDGDWSAVTGTDACVFNEQWLTGGKDEKYKTERIDEFCKIKLFSDRYNKDDLK